MLNSTLKDVNESSSCKLTIMQTMKFPALLSNSFKKDIISNQNQLTVIKQMSSDCPPI